MRRRCEARQRRSTSSPCPDARSRRRSSDWAPELCLDKMKRHARHRATSRPTRRTAGPTARHRQVNRDRSRRATASCRRRVDNTLNDAFGQRIVSTMFTMLNQYHVILEVPPSLPERSEALSDIYVTIRPRASRCRSRPSTKSAVKVSPLVVNHQGQFPSVTISFNLAPGVAIGRRRCRHPAGRAPARRACVASPPASRAMPKPSRQSLSTRAAADPRRPARRSTSSSASSTRATSIPLTILSTLPSAGRGRAADADGRPASTSA